MQLLLGRQPFDRDDLAPFGLPGRDQARADEDAVQVDRAGSALALLAGVLGAGQLKSLAQHVEQRLALPETLDLARLGVDRARQPHRRSLQAQVNVRFASTESAWRR